MDTRYSLTLLEKFTCLGTDCPDDCCHGWNLHIDSKTVSNWKNITDESIRDELLQSISILNEDGQAVEVVKQQDDGRCVHLSNTGLCTIQQRCGHEFLPETCRQYPRESVSNKKIQLHTAHLSCPGIVQLLVQQKFTEELFSIESESKQPISELREPNEALEQTTMQIMAEGHYLLSLRLYFLTTILGKISILNTQSDSDKNKLFKTCYLSSKNIKKQLTDIQKHHKQNKLKINKKNAGIYWHLVFSSCRILGENELSNRFNNSLTYQRLKTIYSSENDQSDQYYLKYYKLLQNAQAALPTTIVSAIDLILTKYMLVKFKNHGFPWYLYKNSLELTFLDCVIPYSQIYLLLNLLYESEKKISENDIITIIYKVEKTVAHNTLILQQLEHKPDLLQIASYAGCWIPG